MIKLFLLAVVPFMTEHRNVTPKTEVSTNFYGSVTGIVDNAYIQAHGGGGGGGVDTNAVRDIAREEIVQATNSLNQTLSDALDDKRDLDDLAVYDKVFSEWKITGTWLDPDKDKKPYRVEPLDDVVWSLMNAEGVLLDQKPISSDGTRIEFDSNVTATRAYEFRQSSDRLATTNGVNASIAAATNDSSIVRAPLNEYGQRVFSEPLYVPPGTDDFNINANTYFYDPVYIYNISFLRDSEGNDVLLTLANKADRATTLAGYGITDAAPLSMISESNTTFSNAVLAVGLNIDTNSVAVLNEIASTFGGFPIEGTATTVGGLLAALAAAVAWLKKNKVQTLKLEDGSVVKTAENGVAKLDDFFTESNSLLTGTIDARLPYPLYAVPSTGILKDRAINTTSLASVTVPDNFTDLLVRATVASSLAVTMPEAIATKYGDTFPGEAGEYLITITKTGAAEAYVRTIKLEEVA